MCFSPTGDLIGGAVVVAIGVDACLHVRGRSEYLAVAALPIVLGLHQIDETFVWWWLQGHVASGVGHVAMWVYLIFAMVVLPIASSIWNRAYPPIGSTERFLVDECVKQEGPDVRWDAQALAQCKAVNYLRRRF